MLLTANKSPSRNQIQPDKMWGKQQNTALRSVLWGMQGKRELLIKFLI
jgi:hypothetical protein